MELLKQKIREVGVVLSDEIIKLDAIMNHAIDPALTTAMGQEFARLYREERVTKILTIESSGIPIAFAAAQELNVPLVFARRKKTLNTDTETYCERVPSFTKGFVTDIMVSKEFLNENDRVVLIDDFIANGDAARGLIRIIRRSGATLLGLGIAVEKSFQAGGRTIRESGVRVDSLVKISSLANGQIQFE
ncbi:MULTISPECIES: xanthine phosphoribosyltransferase [unclassified Paenibacillus]|uniref:xanthine phosphoribosyltransferase n=1 Tax=unclassified Paenibacillus TaxID=185978 RepID=UPI001AE3DAE4|nr:MULTISPECIES: xanthine phosphoribosyltransferase [unclassified Paenibacillus]MBP1154818.1 xanthine phosphoribosyltransferase [Paenibacillus sp. PvP091]MBP1169798.1 xanthine phosphoribosyltransferase [Paenibacillus sp. PvR098]MBP2440826.1 xanthine phosphoribosyltransferase [Paenibacillus sp. PvP052]